MPESAAKISVEQLPNRTIHVHKDDFTLGALTYIKPNEKSVEYRYETAAADVVLRSWDWQNCDQQHPG